MLKWKYPIPLGGAPITTNRLEDVLGPELWYAIEALLQGISDPAATGNVGIIVSGCKVTGSGPYNMSAGIVYLNGVFMKHPGFTGLTLPQYIVPVGLVNLSRTFGDGVSRNLLTQEDATHQSGVPGGGQYIGLSTTGNLGSLGGPRLESFMGKMLIETNAGLSTRKKVFQIGDWNMDSTNSVTIVGHGVNPSKIINVQVMIIDDASNIVTPLDTSYLSSGVAQGDFEIGGGSGANLSLNRALGGIFDGPNYDATSFNRGWATIEYVV